MKIIATILLIVICSLSIPARAQTALGTGFTYQGQLKQGGSPVSGSANINFSLWNDASSTAPANKIGSDQFISGVPLNNGLFTVSLNDAGQFGASAFNGDKRWLEINVNGVTLSPRQELTGTPYALLAARPWAISGNNLSFLGNVAIGMSSPGTTLDVNGAVRMTGLWLPTGAGLNKVLTSDGSGIATWQNAAGGGLALPYSGSVNSGAAAFAVTNSNSFGLAISGTGYTGVYGSTSSVNGVAINGSATGGQTANSIGVYGSTESTIGWGLFGLATNTTGGNRGVYGRSDSTGGSGVYGAATATSGANYGVYGTSSSSVGVGVNGTAGLGVSGNGVGAGGSGVYGIGNFAGVAGLANSLSGNSYSIYGFAHTNPSNYSGYFEGRVHIGGPLDKPAGSFKIDHPLDPENKYLYHSFVESPDMKNIYDGVVTTDAKGYATVTMPDWFEPLNRDFRYQLTVLDDGDGDDFAAAKIVQKVKDNRFTIRTSRPKVEVSWQVTGIRHDAFANAHRIAVEEDKNKEERGQYLYPKEHGQPSERGIDHQRIQRHPALQARAPEEPAGAVESARADN